MNAQPEIKLDKTAFYAWLDRQEGRYELENGRIVPMVKVSRNHALIVTNFIKTLAARLDPSIWNVVAAEFAIEIGEQVRFPDVIVEPSGGDGKALECTEAKLLVEVLSPSSVGRDFGLKLAEYKSLDTVEAYVIASQDAPICWLWRRAADAGRAFPEHPLEIHGRDQAIDLPVFAISLPLVEIYRGVAEF